MTMLLPAAHLHAGGPITQLTGALTATSSGATITMPSGTREGDLALLLDVALSGSLTNVVPSGFTQIATVLDSDTRVTMSYKITQAGDASSVLTGMSGTAGQSKALYVCQGDGFITSVSVESVNADPEAGANPVSHTVTSAAGAAPLVVFGGYGLWADDPGTWVFDPAADHTFNHSISLIRLARKFYNSSPADVTVGFGPTGDNGALISCYIEVS